MATRVTTIAEGFIGVVAEKRFTVADSQSYAPSSPASWLPAESPATSREWLPLRCTGRSTGSARSEVMTPTAPDGVRPDWDTYFLQIAEAVATRANCTRRQCGAVIVDAGHRIMGTGYNGAPSGMDGCLEGACPRGRLDAVPHGAPYDDPDSDGYCSAIHAEMNALLWVGRDVRGCIIYVTSDPCPGCLKHAAGAGIERIVYTGMDGRRGEVRPRVWLEQVAAPR